MFFVFVFVFVCLFFVCLFLFFVLVCFFFGQGKKVEKIGHKAAPRKTKEKWAKNTHQKCLYFIFKRNLAFMYSVFVKYTCIL